MSDIAAHPILSCTEAGAWEAALLRGDPDAEARAMAAAGAALARAIERDFSECGGTLPCDAHLLVLVGKGHNGGDALIATRHLLTRAAPEGRATVCLAFGERALRPLAARAWQELLLALGGRVRVTRRVDDWSSPARPYDVVLDGVFGFQFRPPVSPEVAALLGAASHVPARWRAAVDMPSALGTEAAFRADATYATGIVKTPVASAENVSCVGRLRYLDIGFFGAGAVAAARLASPTSAERVLTSGVLAPLARVRPAASDKRDYGHLLILGGSRSYPGALLMTVQAALRSGVGLVTAAAPESLYAALAAAAPEAMWLPWPETPGGSLALEGAYLLRPLAGRVTAAVAGPGLGDEAEAGALVRDLVRGAPWPVVLDANALQPDIVAAASGPVVLTPHGGELARLIGEASVEKYATPARLVVAKGPRPRVCDGIATYLSPHGGPVLARGGSGDLLAGLIGGLLAQWPAELLPAACMGTAWHGRAADLLARAGGAVAVNTTQLLDHLGSALREELVS